jgi:ABC-type Fe3+ transport system substrate-binding protein
VLVGNAPAGFRVAEWEIGMHLWCSGYLRPSEVILVVAMMESNITYDAQLKEPIVAVYPQDGTIVATHPFAILDGAPWVTPDQGRAAAVFLGFLLSDQQQSRLASYGFRPTDPATSIDSPIDPLYGANLRANLVIVEAPGTQVIGAVVELWKCVRLGNCPR